MNFFMKGGGVSIKRMKTPIHRDFVGSFISQVGYFCLKFENTKETLKIAKTFYCLLIFGCFKHFATEVTAQKTTQFQRLNTEILDYYFGIVELNYLCLTS